jgi:anti-anti-sigma factor
MTSTPAVSGTMLVDGGSLIVLRGVIDATAARRADELVRDSALNGASMLVIDVSAAEEVTGALLGVLVRATRKLAWRNRRLLIVCSAPELRRRLEFAGIDELADIVDRRPKL